MQTPSFTRRPLFTIESDTNTLSLSLSSIPKINFAFLLPPVLLVSSDQPGEDPVESRPIENLTDARRVVDRLFGGVAPKGENRSVRCFNVIDRHDVSGGHLHVATTTPEVDLTENHSIAFDRRVDETNRPGRHPAEQEQTERSETEKEQRHLQFGKSDETFLVGVEPVRGEESTKNRTSGIRTHLQSDDTYVARAWATLIIWMNRRG